MVSPFIATTFQNTVREFRAHCPCACKHSRCIIYTDVTRITTSPELLSSDESS